LLVIAFLETNCSPRGYFPQDMKTISMRVSIGREPPGHTLAPVLATLVVVAGLGYAFWYLALSVQGWVASSSWAAQIIQ
jgi:hypothetical protein